MDKDPTLRRLNDDPLALCLAEAQPPSFVDVGHCARYNLPARQGSEVLCAHRGLRANGNRLVVNHLEEGHGRRVRGQGRGLRQLCGLDCGLLYHAGRVGRLGFLPDLCQCLFLLLQGSSSCRVLEVQLLCFLIGRQFPQQLPQSKAATVDQHPTIRFAVQEESPALFGIESQPRVAREAVRLAKEYLSLAQATDGGRPGVGLAPHGHGLLHHLEVHGAARGLRRRQVIGELVVRLLLPGLCLLFSARKSPPRLAN
mmetsp:Transcript_21261/g.60159  ORF Transcript_21261/g.60159 Transcript_21261/m.60159 type:complete len:255 (+) Transcript_21261:229-993(+)